MSISQRIKYLREAMGMNQTQFAVAMGLSRTTAARYEKASDSIALPVEFLSVLQSRGWNINWLITGKGCPEFNVLSTIDDYESFYGELARFILLVLEQRIEVKKIKLSSGKKARLLSLVFFTAIKLTKENVISMLDLNEVLQCDKIIEEVDKLLDIAA